ncbi:MAG: hypothetical protein HW387_1598 [Parachlamydiales bacterium]|nr:hypothetical protein [Parachlamydiales bacterium]
MRSLFIGGGWTHSELLIGRNFPRYATICQKISSQVDNMARLYSWLPIILSYTATDSAQAPVVVHYEPSIVQLTGTLKECICPGPPEYENIEMGDAPERIFVLMLDHPVHVRELAPKKDFLDEPEDNVTEIQVAASSSEAQPILGKHVKISGTLFHAITAHHRTEVIMINDSMNIIE